jgi:hypothetical protein
MTTDERSESAERVPNVWTHWHQPRLERRGLDAYPLSEHARREIASLGKRRKADEA